VPDSTVVMVDYNQALTVDEALARGRALDGSGLVWIEEPIRHDDYEGCARLAAAIETPVQIGENFDTPVAMARALAVGACDEVMPDFGRILGVTGWMEAARQAADAGLPLSSHLYPEFSVHLLAASPTGTWLEYVDWASPVLQEPLRIQGGHATVPGLPGVGLRWDSDAVARYRVD
jgi:mandelate racemase